MAHETDDGQRGRGTERAVEAYGSAVRTTLRQNATAYGYSVTITAAFSLVTSAYGSAPVLPTVAFAVGAVAAFIMVGSLVFGYRHSRDRQESDSVVLIGGAVDLLSVVAAVGVAAGLALVPGLIAWPLTSFGTIATFLLVGGIDVVIARRTAEQN